MATPTTSEIPRCLAANALDVNQLVDTKTAAKLLGLRNHHTLEVWRSTKRYPELCYHRVGGAIRYRTADLEAFLAANSVGSRGVACSGRRESDNVGGTDARR